MSHSVEIRLKNYWIIVKTEIFHKDSQFFLSKVNFELSTYAD